MQRHIKYYCFTLAFLILSAGASHAFQDTVIDRKNRVIQIDQPFTRIISLYGAHTENLFHLNLDKEIIGVSINDTYPHETNRKQRFSYHDDPEKFIAAAPDLVLIRPMIDNGYPQLIRRLEKYGITVVSLQPSGVNEMYRYWMKLGQLTGKTKEAGQMVAEFQHQVAEIQALTSQIQEPKTVYFEAIHTRMKTFSKGAMPIFALTVAGGQNAAQDAVPSRNTNIANYGKERILAKAGQIDVFIAQQGRMNMITEKQIYQEPGFHIIKALKNKQVYLIDENIISRPVPRLMEGIIQIGTLLYPDIFKKYKATKEQI